MCSCHRLLGVDHQRYSLDPPPLILRVSWPLVTLRLCRHWYWHSNKQNYSVNWYTIKHAFKGRSAFRFLTSYSNTCTLDMQLNSKWLSRMHCISFLTCKLNQLINHWSTLTLMLHIQQEIMLVGWEINVPIQPKNRLYRGPHLGWRFSSARLRMVNDTVTSRPHCLFVQRWPKMGKDREADLSYYATTYNRVETHQPPQDLFISSMCYLV